MSFKHFIITRFNLSKRWDKDKFGNATLDSTWLTDRYRLFEDFCLPSIKGQTSKNFEWWVYFDSETDDFYKNKNDDLNKEFPNFKPKYENSYDDFQNRMHHDVWKNALKEEVKELKNVNQTLEKTPEYLDRIARRDAITISKFNDLLKQWFNNSSEPRISEEIVGVRAWIHIKDRKKIYRLNSDTTLCGVKEYLKKYTNSDWVIVENQRGNRNKVAFGTEKKHIIEGFYLYLVQ